MCECAGALLRYLACFISIPQDRLAAMYVFHGLTGISQVVIATCTTLLANSWFPESERVKATMTSVVVASIGSVAANVVVPAMVDTSSDLPQALWMTTIPSFVVLVLVLVFIRDRPPTPPSPSGYATITPFMVREMVFIGLSCQFIL